MLRRCARCLFREAGNAIEGMRRAVVGVIVPAGCLGSLASCVCVFS